MQSRTSESASAGATLFLQKLRWTIGLDEKTNRYGTYIHITAHGINDSTQRVMAGSSQDGQVTGRPGMRKRTLEYKAR